MQAIKTRARMTDNKDDLLKNEEEVIANIIVRFTPTWTEEPHEIGISQMCQSTFHS